MALLSGLAIWLGSNLKLENVSKRQAAAEFIVERLDQFVHDNMGYHFDKYIPPDRLDLRSEHRLQPHQCHWSVEPHGRPEH